MNDEGTRTSNHPSFCWGIKRLNNDPPKGQTQSNDAEKQFRFLFFEQFTVYIFWGQVELKQWLTWPWQSPETSRRDSKPSIFGNSNIFGFGGLEQKLLADHLGFIILTKPPPYDTKYTDFMFKKLDFYWHPRKDLVNRVICVCVCGCVWRSTAKGFICRSSFDSDVFGEFVGNSTRVKVVWNVFCEISVNSADLCQGCSDSESIWRCPWKHMFVISIFSDVVCWQAPFFRSGLYREELPCLWRSSFWFVFFFGGNQNRVSM